MEISNYVMLRIFNNEDHGVIRHSAFTPLSIEMVQIMVGPAF